MAAAGNPAYIISNKDSMTVTFNVTEKAKNTMNVGDHVTVERNGETFDGTITEIGTMAEQQTKLFQVKATIPGAGDKLPNGVSVKVSATTEKEDGSTLVPFDALYFSGGDAYVYCVVDNKLVRTSVTVGLMDDDHAIIEDGLDADSLVVSNWSSQAEKWCRCGDRVSERRIGGIAGAGRRRSERRGYRGYTRRCSG